MVDSLGGTITRTYDGLNRLLTETTPQGTVTYTYDAAGRRLTMVGGNQAQVNYTYDNANELTAITYSTGSTTLARGHALGYLASLRFVQLLTSSADTPLGSCGSETG